MSISFEKIFGVHTTALTMREKRTEVLASNLANADTPGYKAKDLEFASVLKGAQNKGLNMEASNSQHISSGQSGFSDKTLYRIPNQSSLDGNTVESHIEQGKYMENAVRYQASLNFINGNISAIMTALRGD